MNSAAMNGTRSAVSVVRAMRVVPGSTLTRADRRGARSRRAPRVSCRSANFSRKSSAHAFELAAHGEVIESRAGIVSELELARTRLPARRLDEAVLQAQRGVERAAALRIDAGAVRVEEHASRDQAQIAGDAASRAESLELRRQEQGLADILREQHGAERVEARRRRAHYRLAQREACCARRARRGRLRCTRAPSTSTRPLGMSSAHAVKRRTSAASSSSSSARVRSRAARSVVLAPARRSDRR